MTAQLQAWAPEPFSIVAVGAALTASFLVDAHATGRSLAVKVDGVTKLTWDGATTTVSAGYTGSVTFAASLLSVSLTKDGGWTHATGVAWAVSYTDSLTNAIQRNGAIVYLTESAGDLSPVSGARGVGRRPWILSKGSASGGTVVGMDVEVNGARAIEGGTLQSPAFEGLSGVSGSSGYAVVRSRRFFDHGEIVTVRARLRVSVSGTVYRGSLSRDLVIDGPPPRLNQVEDLARTEFPLLEATRQLVTGALLPTGSGPNLESVLPYFLRRTEIGALAAAFGERAPDPLSVDLPSYASLVDLVRQITPIAPPLFDECARPEERETLLAAWRTGNVLEQIGAVAVLFVNHR